MGSGFTGDWDGRRPPPPPADPYALDRLKAHARILAAQYGIGWKVEVVTYPEGPRLVAQKWPPREGDPLIIARTLEEARERITEYNDEREDR